MIDKKQEELQSLLKEGIFALREMRKGFENACANLRTLYNTASQGNTQRTAGEGKENGLREKKDQGTYILYN